MDRGQIHTLEAFVAALLIVGALLFASQATAVTPLSASTSNQHIENQQRAMASDLLSITANDGTLHEALTHWNVSAEDDNEPAHFRHAPPNLTHYTVTPSVTHPMGEALEDAFETGVYAYNIELRYRTPAGEFDELYMVRMGTPSNNAVTATRTVTLYDHDTLSWDDEDERTLKQLDDDDEFWASGIDDESLLFNVVEVRMTVWRM